MKRKVVNDDEFGKHILSEMKERFIELYKNKSIEEFEKEFAQAKISLEFTVTAKKKKLEPCCVCFSVPAGIICSGECCGDVIASEPV